MHLRTRTEGAAFQITIPGFVGPATALADMVQQRKISASELSLSRVTEQFSAYQGNGADISLEETGEFLRVAARLMLLKSQSLLPQAIDESEEDEGAVAVVDLGGLEGLRDAARQLAELQGMGSIPPLPRPGLMARPVEPRSPLILMQALRGMASRAGREAVQVAAPPFVRLEVALSTLLRRVRPSSVSFHRLLRGADRNEIVVHFLALLELVRRRQVAISQGGLFADITVEWVEHGGESQSRAG